MKSFSSISRSAVLSLATVLLAAGPALAASTTAPSNGLQLKSTNAKLNHTLNSNHVELGQRVTAHLTMDLRTADGVKLPRDTKLIGKVSRIQHGKNKWMSISLVFTKAQLKNGHTIPIKATLLGAMPPAYGYGAADHFPDSSSLIASNAAMDQEPGSLHHIALHSSVQSRNSGTFQSKRGKIDLRAGTQLRIGIAPLQKSATKAG